MSTSSSSAGGGGGLGGGDGAARALLQLEPSTYSEPGAMVSTTEEVTSSSGGGSLRSPPGLPHPVASATAVVGVPKSSSEAQQYGSNTGSTPESTASTKDQAAGSGGVAVGGASSSQQSPSEAQLHLRSSNVSPSPTLKATPIELPMELATRQSQPASQQTTTAPGHIEVNT